jgi:hypothetical protein
MFESSIGAVLLLGYSIFYEGFKSSDLYDYGWPQYEEPSITIH